MTHSARFNQELSWWDQIYYMLTNNGEGLLAVAILPKTPQKKLTGFHIYYSFCIYWCGRNSSVGISTCCWLDGSGFKPRWRRDFLTISRHAPRPTQPPVRWVAALIIGGIAPTTHLLYCQHREWVEVMRSKVSWSAVDYFIRCLVLWFFVWNPCVL